MTDTNGTEPTASIPPRLHTCIACGKEFSVRAPACPSCGEPNPVQEKLSQEAWQQQQAMAQAALAHREQVRNTFWNGIIPIALIVGFFFLLIIGFVCYRFVLLLASTNTVGHLP